jgi:hypothetical protein
MDNIIVYIDDAHYARQLLAPMKSSPMPGHGAGSATHWVLVACAPRMTQRISKWVSNAARENWRTKWSEKLFDQVTPSLRAQGDRTTTMLAKGPLPELTKRLLAEHGPARILDARRPKFGHDLQPVTADQPAPAEGSWGIPGAVVGLGAALVLAAE